MERQEYGLASGVLVDRCPHGHGLWLDVGELYELEVFFERVRRESKEEGGLWARLLSFLGAGDPG